MIIRKEKITYISLVACLLLVIAIVSKKNKDIKVLNEELKILSERDFLTNLYNRRFMTSYLKEIKKEGEKITIVMMDVDYFKKYNDNYGHIAGDKVLQEIAKLIEDIFNKDICVRYGGEEFVLISFRNKEEIISDVKLMMLKLRAKNIIHQYSEASDRITISAGIESDQIFSEEDIERIVKSADKKLYEAKMHGRNKFYL